MYLKGCLTNLGKSKSYDYKETSGNNTGTIFLNMNVISIVNAKTSNVLGNFNTCKEYVNI